MTVLPTNLTRVPTFLSSRLSAGNIGRTNVQMLRVQNQLASGVAMSSASEDPVRASGILTLQSRLGRVEQQGRNLEFAGSILDTLTATNGGPLSEALNIADEAYQKGFEQLGLQGDPAVRQQTATLIDGMVRSLFDQANRKVQGLYMFGGSTPGTQPVIEGPDGGYRFVGRGSGLLTDLGLSERIPITLGPEAALGATSARQRGTVAFSPTLTEATRLEDLRGGRGLGVTPGQVQFSFNGGTPATVDLTGATTVGEVVTRLNSAIGQYETDNGVSILQGAGVSVGAGSGGALAIDVVGGGTLRFSDLPFNSSGADLGLVQTPFTNGPTPQAGADLQPRVTLRSSVSSLGLPPLGEIRIRMTGGVATAGQPASRFYTVNLSGAATIDEIRNRIETTVPGARVQIGDDGQRIDILNEVAGRTMSVEEVPGSAEQTAGLLGIRTISSNLAINDFNFGRGVSIVDGVRDPRTGNVERGLNTDFRVYLRDGQWFDVDLVKADMVSVQTVLDKINAEFAAAVGTQNDPGLPAIAAGDLLATISSGPNGLAFESTRAGSGSLRIERRNNSAAAEQLGLLSLTQEPISGEWVGQDKTGVQVDNIFTHMIGLADALRAGDNSGMTFAGESLKAAMDRLRLAQGLAGSYAQRVNRNINQLEESKLLDQTLLSSLADTDYSDASIKLSQLNVQLQATLQAIGTVQGQTLFDFLR
jgi:flagellar hook-associated protein 3 FlgL